MPNDYFQFKQFTIYHHGSAMKVGTDSVLLGAWAGIGRSENLRALDIGTGSGILAIMLAQRFPQLQIDAVEVDEQAYLQAVENVAKCPWSDRIRLHNESFQSFADKHSNGYDLLISNPPYFIQSLESPCEKRSMARHTASLSQEELIAGALKAMRANAVFALVLPVAEGISFIETAEKQGLYCNKRLSVKPDAAKPVKRWLMEFSHTKTAIEESELCIDSGVRHEYSEEYKALTKEFYLKF